MITPPLEQNIPTTASIGSFEGAGISSTRTDNTTFENESSMVRTWRHSDISNYLSNISYPTFVMPLSSLLSLMQLFASIEANAVSYTRVFDLLKVNSKSVDLPQTTALRKLDELKNLAEDWDSYGAEPISPEAIAKAKSIIISTMIAFDGIIDNVVRLTDVIPIADGGVQLEWTGPHAELEVEISPDGTIGLLYIWGSEDRRNYEESEDNSLQDVYAMIGKLILSQYNN